MRRLLLTAGAVLVLAAPAFAQSSVTIEKRSVETKEVPATRVETKEIPATTVETKEVPATGSTVATVIVAPNPPPAPEAETPPVAPGPTMVWTPGYWRWNPERQNYTWVSGKYVEPPRAHAAWMPGHWRQEPRGWIWEEGHWN